MFLTCELNARSATGFQSSVSLPKEGAMHCGGMRRCISPRLSGRSNGIPHHKTEYQKLHVNACIPRNSG
jgi:hypothetical protein